MSALQFSDARGPFFGVPIERQEAQCRAWLDANNRADRHMAVRPHTISPPQDGAFNILARVSVSGLWDDKSKIQCNLCNNIRKFKTRGYVASYEDGWWYIVGPDCGGEEFFGRFNTALHQHNRREAERLAEGDLLNLLQSLGAWQVFYAHLKDAVTCADAAARLLDTHHPELFRRLDEARRRDGETFIYRSVRAFNEHGKLYTRNEEHRFTTLVGTKAISRPCVAERLYRRVSGDVQAYLTGEKSLMDAITAHIEKGDVSGLQKQVSEALDNLRGAHANVVEARQFWEPSNLDGVSAWLAHPQARFENIVKFAHSGADARLVSPDDPDWSVTFRLAPLRLYAAAPPQ